MEGDARDREWYRSLLDSTSGVIAVLDVDGDIQYVNRPVTRVLGYEPEELIGRYAFDLIHEDDRATAFERFLDFTDEEGPDRPTATFRFRHADGHWCHVEGIGQTKFNADDEDAFVVSVREITDRLRRQQELVRYETIIETAPLGMLVLDENGIITWTNDEYAGLLGIPRDELTGTPFMDLVEDGYYDETVVEEYLDQVRTLLSSRNDVETMSYAVETNLPDDDPRVQNAHVTLLPLEDGEFRGTVIAYRDVTKQREYEAELERQNERLDRFASTVSHDLRNPLSVAKGRVDLARETGDLEHLEHVADAHEQMESLIDRLLSLARHDETGDLRPVALRSATETAWQAVESDGASLDVLEDDTVVADPTRLRQVFENLFRNSLEHGTNGGEPVSVTVGQLDDREGFFVADDGRGIPPEDRERIFEYGYTTDDDGTGFGLDIVRSVVDAHGWSVSLAESDDGGARFEIETDEATAE